MNLKFPWGIISLSAAAEEADGSSMRSKVTRPSLTMSPGSLLSSAKHPGERHILPYMWDESILVPDHVDAERSPHTAHGTGSARLSLFMG